MGRSSGRPTTGKSLRTKLRWVPRPVPGDIWAGFYGCLPIPILPLIASTAPIIVSQQYPIVALFATDVTIATYQPTLHPYACHKHHRKYHQQRHDVYKGFKHFLIPFVFSDDARHASKDAWDGLTLLLFCTAQQSESRSECSRIASIVTAPY